MESIFDFFILLGIVSITFLSYRIRKDIKSIKRHVQNERVFIQKLNLIMASIQDLKAQVAQLQADLDNEQAQVAAALEALNVQIAELKDIVAEGGTAEDRQAIADALTAISEDLKGTIPDESTTTSTTESTTETTTEAPVEPEA